MQLLQSRNHGYACVQWSVTIDMRESYNKLVIARTRVPHIGYWHGSDVEPTGSVEPVTTVSTDHPKKWLQHSRLAVLWHWTPHRGCHCHCSHSLELELSKSSLTYSLPVLSRGRYHELPTANTAPVWLKPVSDEHMDQSHYCACS